MTLEHHHGFHATLEANIRKRADLNEKLRLFGEDCKRTLEKKVARWDSDSETVDTKDAAADEDAHRQHEHRRRCGVVLLSYFAGHGVRKDKKDYLCMCDNGDRYPLEDIWTKLGEEIEIENVEIEKRLIVRRL